MVPLSSTVIESSIAWHDVSSQQTPAMPDMKDLFANQVAQDAVLKLE